MDSLYNVITLLLFLKMSFKWLLDDSKGNLIFFFFKWIKNL